MANRRMFSRDFVESDAFLDLSPKVQALYFHLSLGADDDGMIANSRTITRMLGCGGEDLQTLIEKKFIIRFDSGVCCVRHWKINNYIRSDRYKETIYQKEKAMLCENDGVYEVDTDGVPKDNQMGAQCSIEENREEKEQSRADKRARVCRFQDFFVTYPKQKNMVAAEKEYCLLLFNDQNLTEQELIDAAKTMGIRRKSWERRNGILRTLTDF